MTQMNRKRIIIVHGWDGYPQEGWFPWLKKELEQVGCEVIVPQLPESATPRIYNWVPALAAAVGAVDEHTFFVGHSMGCQTIARFLEGLPEGVRCGGVVFVAGFFTRLTNLESDDEVREIVQHWLTSPLNLEKVATHIPRSVALFSDNDRYVPLENVDVYRDVLRSEIIIEHGRGHFSGASDGCVELPAARDVVLSMIRS